MIAMRQSNFLMQKRRGTGLSRGFEWWEDSLAQAPDPHRGSTASAVADLGLAWLEQTDADRPWLLVLHFFDPHGSYEDHAVSQFADPAYEGWVVGGAANSLAQRQAPHSTEADLAQLRAYYDEEVRAVDTAFGRVLDALRQRSDWEDTVVVFTSDHGEELGERGYIGHTRTLHAEQVDLPLVVRLPKSKQAGSWVEHEFSQKDLAGTLLDLVGEESDLFSIAPLLRAESQSSQKSDFSTITFEVDFVPILEKQADKRVRKRGLATANLRYWKDLLTGEEFLYDLHEDPRETQNLIADSQYQDHLLTLRLWMENSSYWEAD